jgi:hypothetical protein
MLHRLLRRAHRRPLLRSNAIRSTLQIRCRFLPIRIRQDSTPITGNGTGTTGAVVGTLPAAAAKTTFICGFAVSALGGTAAVGPVTIAGLIGSSMVYYCASAAAGAQLNQTFTPCIPGSAVNTAITTTTTADGTASNVAVNSWGYQK